MVVGVDGCKGGWIAATRRGARRIDALELLLREALPDVVAVDIPVGLSDAGPRRCDQEARALLRGRASSVFRAPIRPMLAARSQSEASALGRSLDGKGISAQSWAITGKIREVDELLRRDGKARRAIREVHPELSFSRLNGGVALAEGKREPAGIERRLALLEAAFGRVVRDAAESRRALRCGADDVLDAFAALWSAERIARGVALSLPADPPRDRFGIAMAISA